MTKLGDLALHLCEQLGIRRVKLTGGEPLLRRGLPQLVERLRTCSGIEVSLTSNGTLLGDQADTLARAGLGRVNISLDTLDPERFSVLTGGGRLEETLRGIAAAHNAGLHPIKLNSVLRASSWRQDVPGLLDFATTHEIEIRFIELMRTGTAAAWVEAEYVPVSEVQKLLLRHGRLLSLPTVRSAPAWCTQARWGGRMVRVGWIAPRSAPFCGSCDRLRLDAEGALRRCLMDPERLSLVNLPGLDRAVASRRLPPEVVAYLAGKRPPRTMESLAAMSVVGG